MTRRSRRKLSAKRNSSVTLCRHAPHAACPPAPAFSGARRRSRVVRMFFAIDARSAARKGTSSIDDPTDRSSISPVTTFGPRPVGRADLGDEDPFEARVSRAATGSRAQDMICAPVDRRLESSPCRADRVQKRNPPPGRAYSRAAFVACKRPRRVLLHSSRLGSSSELDDRNAGGELRQRPALSRSSRSRCYRPQPSVA